MILKMHKRENKSRVKSTYYRYIFNTRYNTDFHFPKTDRYEKCDEINIKKSQLALKKIDLHITEKLAIREEKRLIDHQ